MFFLKTKGLEHSFSRSEIQRMCAAAKSVSHVLSTLIARGGESMKSFGGIRERGRCKALIFAKRNIAFVRGRDIHFVTRFFRIFDTDCEGWD